jgi:hypothetical protein
MGNQKQSSVLMAMAEDLHLLFLNFGTVSGILALYLVFPIVKTFNSLKDRELVKKHLLYFFSNYRIQTLYLSTWNSKNKCIYGQ